MDPSSRFLLFVNAPLFRYVFARPCSDAPLDTRIVDCSRISAAAVHHGVTQPENAQSCKGGLGSDRHACLPRGEMAQISGPLFLRGPSCFV